MKFRNQVNSQSKTYKRERRRARLDPSAQHRIIGADDSLRAREEAAGICAEPAAPNRAGAERVGAVIARIS